MNDWEVSTGELAALATRMSGEATLLHDLTRRIDQVSVGAADFGGRPDIAQRYTEAVRSGLAGAVRDLADEIDNFTATIFASTRSYDGHEQAASDIVTRLGGAP
jgi:hypothetical protein